MTPKSTRYLVVVALGLLAYIFFFERHRPTMEERAVASGRLLANFDPAKVTSVELNLGTNQLVRVERAGEEWRMTLPVVFPADSSAVNGLLETLASLNRHTSISAREVMQQPGGESAYGIAPARATIVAQAGDRRIEVLVGNKVIPGEQVYVKLLGGSGIEVTEAALAARLPATADGWRSRALVNIGSQLIDRLAARAGVAFYELQADFTNNLWRLAQPLPARANSGEVEVALQQLGAARIQGFVSDLPKPDLDAYGLSTPSLQLSLGRGSNVLWSVAFGNTLTNKPDLVYAQLPGGNVVTVEKSVADSFRPRPPVTRFRETRLINVPTNSLDLIEVRAKESFALQRQTNGSWRMIRPVEFAVDPFLLGWFVHTLNHLEVMEFVRDVVPDFTPYGFTTNCPQYTLFSTRTNGGASTNVALAQIQLGSRTNNSVLARRTDESSVYGLSYLDAFNLPQFPYQLRDRHIWSFTTNEVLSLTVSFHGQTRRVTRNATGQWISPGANPLIGPMAEEVAYRLGRLEADRWTGRGMDVLPAFGFDKAAHQVTVEVKVGEKVESRVLQFGAISPLRTPYAAVLLDGQPAVFVLASDIYNPYEIFLGGLNLPAGDGAR
ncbi:MAG TPA: DUF4340 domain-containing protein [Verrucomicrobiae bacterium]|nr:DUF4340 domain-containing protein [Verrucomicrobiae bacterium]